MFESIWSKSAYFRTPQLHSGSVEDHLDTSRHLWSYLSAFGNHQDTSATFRVCRRPSGPIETSSELSTCCRQPSGHISYIQGLSGTICTHRNMFGAIWSKSAYFRTPQLHSGSVEDHLDPSRHLRSYLSAFGNHRDTSATFRDCLRPYESIKTSSELSNIFIRIFFGQNFILKKSFFMTEIILLNFVLITLFCYLNLFRPKCFSTKIL